MSEDLQTPEAIVEPILPPRERSVALQLLILAGPMIGAMMSRTVMSFVDFVMVSRLGPEAQAAIMPALMVLFILICFGMGLVTAVNTFVSQSLGKDRPRECSVYNWQGVYLSVIIGLICLPGWFFVPTLYGWFGHEPAVMQLEIEYTKIGLLGIAPNIAVFSLSNFYNGIHRPAIGFIATVAGNVFNIIANYALIFGNFGFPKLGMAGAAIASVLATILITAILIGWLALPSYRGAYHAFETMRFSWKHTRDLLKVGLPIGAHFIVDVFAWMMFTSVIVGRFGTAHLAASNTAFKFMELSFMPAVGISSALTAAVGKCIGQGRHDLAKRFVNSCILITLGYMGTAGLVIYFFRYDFMGMMSEDQEIIDIGAKVLICAAIFQIFDALHLTYSGALRGAGDTNFPAVAAFFNAVGVVIGGAYFVAWKYPELGSLGPWMAGTVSVVVIGVALALRYFFGPWERLKLVE